MARAERGGEERYPMGDPAPGVEIVGVNELQVRARALGDFLDGPHFETAHVTSVMPTTMGIFYRLTLFRKQEDGTTLMHLTDSGAVRLLKEGIKSMSRKKRKKVKAISKNLKLIGKIVNDTQYWNMPYNQRGDH
jgi:hypothetical protein